tara:strand:+ start:712 stop:1368 length:657 start_codon:yes stop_codon:yes gene_type:complete
MSKYYVAEALDTVIVIETESIDEINILKYELSLSEIDESASNILKKYCNYINLDNHLIKDKYPYTAYDIILSEIQEEHILKNIKDYELLKTFNDRIDYIADSENISDIFKIYLKEETNQIRDYNIEFIDIECSRFSIIKFIIGIYDKNYYNNKIGIVTIDVLIHCEYYRFIAGGIKRFKNITKPKFEDDFFDKFHNKERIEDFVHVIYLFIYDHFKYI